MPFFMAVASLLLSLFCLASSVVQGSEARDVLASFPALLQHVVPVILEPVGRDDLLGHVPARDGSDCPCATPVDARSLRRPIHYGHTS